MMCQTGQTGETLSAPRGKLESKGTVRRNVEEKVARGSDFAMGQGHGGETGWRWICCCHRCGLN